MQATSKKKKGLNQFKPELNCMRTKSQFGLVQETVQSQFSSEGSFSKPVLFPVHKKMLQNQTKLNHSITTPIHHHGDTFHFHLLVCAAWGSVPTSQGLIPV